MHLCEPQERQLELSSLGRNGVVRRGNVRVFILPDRRGEIRAEFGHGVEHVHHLRRCLIRNTDHLLRQFVQQSQEAGLAVMPRVGRQAMLVRLETLADHRDSKVIIILLTVQSSYHEINGREMQEERLVVVAAGTKIYRKVWDTPGFLWSYS